MTSTEIDKIAYRNGDPAMMITLPGASGEFAHALHNYAFLLFDNNPSLLVKRAGLKKAVKTPAEFRVASNMAAISFLGVAMLREASPGLLTTLLAITGLRLGEPNTLNGLKSLGEHYGWGDSNKKIREIANQAREEFDEALNMILQVLREPMPDSPSESICSFGFKVTRDHLENFDKAMVNAGRSPAVKRDLFLDLLLVNRLISILRFAHNGSSQDEGVLLQVFFGEGKLPPSLLSGWTKNLPALIDTLRNCAKTHYDAGMKPFIAAELAAQDCIVQCLRKGELICHRNNLAVADFMTQRLWGDLGGARSSSKGADKQSK